MLTGYATRVGPPPDPRTLGFRAWMYRAMDTVEEYCVQQCAANPVFYFDSVGGSDSNTGTSAASPWQTISKIQALITDNPNGNYSMKWKKGSLWQPTYGLTLGATANNVSITSYGVGSTPPIIKPLMMPAIWTFVSGTLWKYATPASMPYYGSTVVAAVRMASTADPSTLTGVSPAVYAGCGIADASLVPLYCMNSSATVEATIGSWWWDSAGTDPNSGSVATLYLNLGSTTAPPTMEWIGGNTTDGIVFGGDGVLIRGVRADMFGAIAANAGISVDQYYGFRHNPTTAGFAACIADCEAYYSNYHCAGLLNSYSGGAILVRGGRFGYCCNDSTALVGFAQSGAHEVYFDDNEILPGLNPSQAAIPAGVSGNGQPFYAHAGTGAGALYIANRTKVRIVRNMACSGANFGGAPAASDITQSRAFVVDLVHDDPQGQDYDPSFMPYLGEAPGIVYINPKMSIITNSSNPYYVASGVSNGWGINPDISLTVRGVALTAVNETYAAGSTLQIFGGKLTFAGNLASGWNFFNPNYSASTSDFENTDFVVIGNPMASFTGGSPAPSLFSNCYEGISTYTDSHGVAAQSVHVGSTVPRSTLSELFMAGHPCSDGVALEYDIDWNPRNLVTPNIGPREVNPGLSVVQAQTVRFGYETGRTLTFQSYTAGSSPTLVQTIPLTESPAGSSNYVTSTALTLGTPITYTITDSVSGVVGTGVM